MGRGQAGESLAQEEGSLSTHRVELERTARDGASRQVWVCLEADGDLVFMGQALGPAAPEGGLREYEWSVRVAAEHLPRLRQSLGLATLGGLWPVSEARLLRALRRRFSGRATRRIEPFLEAHGIPASLWRRTAIRASRLARSAPARQSDYVA